MISFLGTESVERVLKGKHYNHAIRIYQYVYDAVSRMFIKSFREWLSNQNNLTFETFTTSDEFKECLEDVSRSFYY